MKNVQSLIFRARCFLLAGILMFFFTDSMTKWFVVVIGVLFLVPGLVSIATFFRTYARKDATRVLLPIIGAGSILLGAILILFPQRFTAILMYVLAAAIILAAVTALVNLIHFRKYTTVSPFAYVIPVLLCATGIFLIFYPQDNPELPFKIFGVASMVYALTEIYYAIHFRKVFRQIRQEVQAQPQAAETTEETAPTANESAGQEETFTPTEETVTVAEENAAPPATAETSAPAPSESPDENAQKEEATAGTIDFSQDAQPENPQ